jgi:hypothetical protein
MSNPPTAPKALAAPQRALWDAILDDLDASPGELRMLADALTLTQRADELAAAISNDGVVISDRYGNPRAHPGLDAEIRCRTSAAQLLHKLNVSLPDEPRENRVKPGPRRKSQRAAAR